MKPRLAGHSSPLPRFFTGASLPASQPYLAGLVSVVNLETSLCLPPDPGQSDVQHSITPESCWAALLLRVVLDPSRPNSHTCPTFLSRLVTYVHGHFKTFPHFHLAVSPPGSTPCFPLLSTSLNPTLFHFSYAQYVQLHYTEQVLIYFSSLHSILFCVISGVELVFVTFWRMGPDQTPGPLNALCALGIK